MPPLKALAPLSSPRRRRWPRSTRVQTPLMLLPLVPPPPPRQQPLDQRYQ
jgi:hypothetical protein